MNCCINCFCDSEIYAIISSRKQFGDCYFCNSINVLVYDINSVETQISQMMISLVNTYSPSNSETSKPLSVALRDDWDIFNINNLTIDKTLELIKSLCSSDYHKNDKIFENGVNIPVLADNDFLCEFCVVQGNNWEAFSNAIKYDNRYHSGMFNTDVFTRFLSMFEKKLPIKSRFYRARVAESFNGFSTDSMGAPPPGKRSVGRINPEGIGTLYLGNSPKTALAEIRAATFDFVTIGTFENCQEYNIVDFSAIDAASPFLFDGNLEQFAANKNVLKEIAAEIAKPLRRSDSHLEYLPTQFISEFIKSKDYAGVEYKSTLNPDGYNLAMFDTESFICHHVQTISVTEINYIIDQSLSILS
ncbi:MAG: RES family NAD+ phosphorylase [Oscillospiraceae bacterium]|nr:RES family NAD+ phosphorylase [Oscillospiraceae bacterium]